MDDESSQPGAEDRGTTNPWRALAALTAAIVLSIAATALPANAVVATLAFFAWAIFLSRGVIDFPGELGMIWKDEDEPESGTSEEEGPREDDNL